MLFFEQDQLNLFAMKTAHLLAFLACLNAFSLTAQCEFTELTFTTSTLEWGAEMSWELYHVTDGGDQLLATYQGEMDNASSSDVVCLEDGCYYFLLLDSWGDGWNGGTLSCEPAIPGFAQDVTLYAGDYGYHSFQVGDDACEVVLEGCGDFDALNYIQGVTVDDGSCIYAQTFDSVVNGVSTTREYIYYHPEDMQAGAPLVFVLHGYFGTAASMYDFSGFKELADQEGFGVVWPQGLPDGAGNNHWNANFDWGSETDLEFLVQLAQHLQNEYSHSPACTYSCGYSNGGYMSYSLACRAADTFRGIGSVGGTMSNNDWNDCQPVEQVPVVHLHGTQDETILYQGTDNWQWGWGQQPGVETIVAWWAEQNSCTSLEEWALPNTDPTDGSDVDVIWHYGGTNGYQSKLYRINGGGHDWFGAFGNMDVNSAVEMYDFWRQFCEGTADIEETSAPEQSLFSLNGSNGVVAQESFELLVVDLTGRTVVRRPMLKGQQVSLTSHQGIHLIVGRTSTGIQTAKTFLGGAAQ